MAVKDQVQVLLSKKMDRQDFIKHVAIGLVAMTGASAMLRALTIKQKQPSVDGGYGASAYGGIGDLKKTK